MEPFKITNKEANLLDRIASATKMDCWFYLDENNHFEDIEEHKPMTDAEGVCLLEDGLAYGLDEPQSGGLSAEEIRIVKACFKRAREEMSQKEIQKLKTMVEAKEDITSCVALYLDLYEDTDVMHRNVVEEEIEDLKNGDEENNMEAGRLELMLKDNPLVTYFDYYNETPITFDWLRKRLGLTAEDSYEKAICILSDNGFGQDLTTVLVACACRNAIDAFEEEKEIMRTPFGVFCNVVSDLWVDCEDGTCVCRIADMLVQWIIHHPGDHPYPTSFPELKRWAENEGEADE